MNFLFYTEKLIKVFIENMVIVGIIYDSKLGGHKRYIRKLLKKSAQAYFQAQIQGASVKIPFLGGFLEHKNPPKNNFGFQQQS